MFFRVRTGFDKYGICRVAGALAGLLLCRGGFASSDIQSITDATGRQAVHVEKLYWFYFWCLAAIYVLVLVFLGIALTKRKRLAGGGLAEAATHPPRFEKGLTVGVSVAVGATIIMLFVFLVGDYVTGKKLHNLSSAENPVSINVLARQWWWEVKYNDAQTSNMVTTANEIHLPIGRPVKIDLQSEDVIHSFWIPNLGGKRDMIPGHATSIWLRADEPAYLTGQCAEFCGLQHAHMRMTVTAEPEEKFQAWLAAQRQSPPDPQTSSTQRGREVFRGSSCVMCHTISGTGAFGTVGPNLTHIASRPTLAAGTLKNTRGNLAGWILDPQRIKPGTRMPQNVINPEDLNALLDYLESLK